MHRLRKFPYKSIRLATRVVNAKMMMSSQRYMNCAIAESWKLNTYMQ